MTLVEKYSKRIKLAESVYANAHNGAKMDNLRKVTTARCLENVNAFLNEAFDASMGTQKSALGDYKKFCLALTNISLPNQIAFDLVATQPMASWTGSIAYLEYVKSIDKGASKEGDLVNGIWELGTPDANYSGSAVVEPVTTFTSGTTAVAFKLGAANVRLLDENGAQVDDVDGEHPATINATTGVITQTSFKAGKSATDVKKIAYIYNNIEVPQEKTPGIKAVMRNIPLEAKARRLTVFYSQIAAFQAKQDYGFDLADGLAEQAVAELNYEIDTEICSMLIEAAPTSSVATWSKTVPIGVSVADHYAGFAAKIEEYKMVIYNQTKKFMPTFMLASSDMIPVLCFVPGFQQASVNDINGPYFAGTLNGLKVFVTPNIAEKTFVFGVNKGALQASAGVYAPYMPIVPTMLLQFADGGTTQGWSTLYDAKVLNANLLVKGTIEE